MKTILLYLPLLCYLFVGQLYEIDAIDKAQTQWVYLNVVNIFCLLLFLFKKDSFQLSFKKLIFTTTEFLILVAFLSTLAISVLYAENHAAGLIKLFRWLTVAIMSFNLIVLLKISKPSLKLVAGIVTVALCFDLYFTYQAYFQFIEFSEYKFQFANYLKGVSGNKNITAASFIMRLPFVIYLFYASKKPIVKFFFCGIAQIVVYALLLLSARASFISLALIALMGIGYELYLFKRLQNKSRMVFNTIGFSVIFLLPLLLSSYTLKQKSAAFFTDRIATINTEDQSTQERLRYYGHALNRFIENPIQGVGLGNWKIKSIDLDKQNINSYIVPYHVHNDFLEIAAESGVFAVLTYIFLFYYVARRFIRMIFLTKLGSNQSIFGLIMLMSGMAFIIDSLLNFPHARPLMMVLFGFTLALSSYVKSENYESDSK